MKRVFSGDPDHLGPVAIREVADVHRLSLMGGVRSQNVLDFVGVSFASVVEHLYD